MKLNALAPFCLLLCGCQLMSYQEPDGEHTATIAFSSNEVAVQPLICVPGEGFKPTELSVAGNHSDSDFSREMNEALKKAVVVTTKLDASLPSTIVGFSMQIRQGNGPRKRCKVAARFPIEAGHSYEADLIADDDICGITIKENGQPINDAFIVPWECQ